MRQARHGSATTTYAVPAAIQRSQASLATLSRELGISRTKATLGRFLMHGTAHSCARRAGLTGPTIRVDSDVIDVDG